MKMLEITHNVKKELTVISFQLYEKLGVINVCQYWEYELIPSFIYFYVSQTK